MKTLSFSLSSCLLFWRQRLTDDEYLWLQFPGLEPSIFPTQGRTWELENSIKAWPALQVCYCNTNYTGRWALGNKTRNESAEILASAEWTESVGFRGDVHVRSLSLHSLTPDLNVQNLLHLPRIPARSSSLSFPFWRRKLPPPSISWTVLFPISLRYEVYSTPSPAEAPVRSSALLGKTSIAVGRGWVHRWEEVARESWLEGLEEHWIWESVCHENKGSNCSSFPTK